ncbi:MAG: hypothetical protein A3G18_06245 [Rhodospirillales bacterium RIFCSPLOWO2_12_FULL_58_28]|nr:MAG: hypothetical protein A3H92_12540 [Rhodospirillales bacterium RIFCSPLOWO2_02_FULL_58_16]OHC76784.1 MAG: hypothetical protein A3G18_06245 [Rhodospirillales bacterium RIFCSPLOWO2_12_FULL_58_28]
MISIVSHFLKKFTFNNDIIATVARIAKIKSFIRYRLASKPFDRFRSVTFWAARAYDDCMIVFKSVEQPNYRLDRLIVTQIIKKFVPIGLNLYSGDTAFNIPEFRRTNLHNDNIRS